jgi:hypothetical protein
LIYEQKLENYAEVAKRASSLVELSNEFVTFARDMAKYIIRDLALPTSQRMIRPILEQKGVLLSFSCCSYHKMIN